jgi:MoxR-like ATPase
MMSENPLASSLTALRAAIADAGQGLIEREALVESIALAAVAGEHVLVIGPPGAAKSEAVRRISRAIGGHYFEYLLGRFTEPSEIFGPVDLRRLREGFVETETTGMLPEAEIAFLDEVFLGSTAILNTLLGILNERVFRRGHTQAVCPLRLCVGASNGLPEDDTLGAFADRFLVRVFLDPLPDTRLEELLEGGWALGNSTVQTTASIADLDALAAAARQMDMAPIRPFLAHALRLLRAAGIPLSDRRAVKTQKLVAAAAVVAGRTQPTEADLWPIVLATPTAETQELARQTLREILDKSENATLKTAAEAASLGPLARAARLVEAGRRVLAEHPDPSDARAAERRRLALEGVAREIDAGFAREALPPDLIGVRAEIVATLSTDAPNISERE